MPSLQFFTPGTAAGTGATSVTLAPSFDTEGIFTLTPGTTTSAGTLGSLFLSSWSGQEELAFKIFHVFPFCNGVLTGFNGQLLGLYPIGMSGSGFISLGCTTAPIAPSSVSAVSNGGSSPTTVTTSAAHGLATGQSVTITGTGGATAINATFGSVTVASSTTFTVPVANSNAWTSGGTVNAPISLAWHALPSL